MGRYANRFVAGGSNTIGATFTAADGGGNTAYAVAANGQSLSRTEYPGLARFYSGQTEFDTLRITSAASGLGSETWIAATQYTDYTYGGGQVAASYGNFSLYAQRVSVTLANYTQNYAFWYTEDAENWKLVDTPSTPIGSAAGLIATTGGIYICHSSGLHKTTNGTTLNSIYSTSNGVYTVADLGPTTIFSTGGTGIIKTNDFINFTGVDVAAGFTVNNLVVHSGVLYAFCRGASGVYYSTNTGNTWTQATSGMLYEPSFYVTSTGGYVIASINQYSNGIPVFQYSANPTGTTNTWAAVTQTKTGTIGGSTDISHILYDSGTTNLVVCLNRQLANAVGIFGYTFTGVTGAAITYTGNLVNNYLPPTYSATNHVATFAFNASGKRGFALGPCAMALPDTGGTTWSGTRFFAATNTSAVHRPNPFFHLQTMYSGGFYTVGTTNSGTRYIFKGCSNGDSTNFTQLSVFVEESGFFKPLKATATGEFANLNLAGAAYSNIQETSACLAEASGNYILAWTSTAVGQTGIYYNAYSQATRRSLTNISSGGVGGANSAILGATKSNGIYISPSGGSQLYNLDPPNGPLTFYIVSPDGTLSTRNYNTNFSGAYLTFSFSNLNNSVVVSTTSTGTVSGLAVVFDGTSFTPNSYLLTNSTGGIVTPLSGTHILQSNGKYYAVDPSGLIYKGASLSTLTFNNYSNRPPTGTITGTTKRYTEISKTRTVGNASLVINDYAGITFSTAHTSPGTLSSMNRVDTWKVSGEFTYAVGTANRFSALAQTSGSGSFSVPNITSTVPGQAIYIIAR